MSEPPSAAVEHYAARHRERAAELARLETPSGEVVTPEYLTACVRRQVGSDAIVVNEGITNYPAICDHMAREKPGTMFASGGGSLGWAGGAAIGMKLAAPDKTFVAMTGDGSYMFSQPSTVHWMARRYQTPFLQIIFNNRGWKAPKFSALAVHPDGFASRAEGSGPELRSAAGLFRHRRRGGRRIRPRDQAPGRGRSRRRRGSAGGRGGAALRRARRLARASLTRFPDRSWRRSQRLVKDERRISSFRPERRCSGRSIGGSAQWRQSCASLSSQPSFSPVWERWATPRTSSRASMLPRGRRRSARRVR